jgi:hypothetical protein
MKNTADYALEFDCEREAGKKVGRGLGGHSTSSRRHPRVRRPSGTLLAPAVGATPALYSGERNSGKPSRFLQLKTRTGSLFA